MHQLPDESSVRRLQNFSSVSKKLCWSGYVGSFGKCLIALSEAAKGGDIVHSTALDDIDGPSALLCRVRVAVVRVQWLAMIGGSRVAEEDLKTARCIIVAEVPISLGQRSPLFYFTWRRMRSVDLLSGVIAWGRRRG